jgi:hypothetical protein
MTELNMTAERVLELILAYGAETGGWPEDEREAARVFLEAEPARFAEALSEARLLDTLMMDLETPEPPASLSETILARAPKAMPQQNSLIGLLGKTLFPQGVKWPAGAALASLLMGLVGGYAYASTGIGYDQADSAYYMAFGFESDQAWLETE